MIGELILTIVFALSWLALEVWSSRRAADRFVNHEEHERTYDSIRHQLERENDRTSESLEEAWSTIRSLRETLAGVEEHMGRMEIHVENMEARAVLEAVRRINEEEEN